MSQPDYIADQLRAMGLEPDVLGKPIVMAAARDRCSATNPDGRRCVLAPDHTGDHLRGRDRWSNDDQRGPQDEPSDPDDEHGDQV